MDGVVDTVFGGDAAPYSAEGGFGSNAAELDSGGEVELVGGKRRRFRMRKKNKTYRRKGKKSKKSKKPKRAKTAKRSGKKNYLSFCASYAKKHGFPNARAVMKNPQCKAAFHAQ